MEEKTGFDVIRLNRFAFKRLCNQDPLVDGQGNVVPEPDSDSEDWKGWKLRFTDERADEIVATKKGHSPPPIQEPIIALELESVYIKVDDEDVDGVY